MAIYSVFFSLLAHRAFAPGAADFCGYQRAAFPLFRFVSRAKLIKNHATINEDVEGDKQALQAEIKHLKRTLAALQVAFWTRAKNLGWRQSPPNDSCMERVVEALMGTAPSPRTYV